MIYIIWHYEFRSHLFLECQSHKTFRFISRIWVDWWPAQLCNPAITATMATAKCLNAMLVSSRTDGTVAKTAEVSQDIVDKHMIRAWKLHQIGTAEAKDWCFPKGPSFSRAPFSGSMLSRTGSQSVPQLKTHKVSFAFIFLPLHL